VRWVQQPAIRPHRCAVIPFLGGHNSRGFIDTGQDMRDHDSHVYISVEAVEQLARLIGWEPTHARIQAEGRLIAKDAQIARLEAELAEAEEFKDAAEYTLSRFDTKVQRKPGRKAAA
jgi:hypothetical protein